MGKGCKQRVRRYLDKGDAKSTSNMAKHVKSCWGPEAYEAAQDAKSAAAAREGVIRNLLRSGTITSSFERKSKGKVSYSHRQHTKTETKYVLGTSMYTNIPLTRR
jgi:stalled ribosome alternative rescue factor ArfA